MRRKVLISVCVVFLMAVVGFAQMPTPTPSTGTDPAFCHNTKTNECVPRLVKDCSKLGEYWIPVNDCGSVVYPPDPPPPVEQPWWYTLVQRINLNVLPWVMTAIIGITQALKYIVKYAKWVPFLRKYTTGKYALYLSLLVGFFGMLTMVLTDLKLTGDDLIIMYNWVVAQLAANGLFKLITVSQKSE